MRMNYKVFILPCAFRSDKNFFASNKHRIKMLELAVEKYFNFKPIIFDSSKGKNDK